MSASEIIAKLDATDTELKIAHAVAIGNLNRIETAITTLVGIESNSPDVAIALQGLLVLRQDMIDSINVLIQTIKDLDNFKQVL